MVKLKDCYGISRYHQVRIQKLQEIGALEY